MSKKASLIILILVSIGVHFAFFGHPNEVVFDEVHFGKFVSAYYNHEYYFDIHPPGGKLIIAGFAKLFNFQPEFSFAKIGQPFPDNKYLALRFLPTLAGTLLPIIIYFLAVELGFSTLGAFGAGMMIVLENALLTQSRYILLDPFLIVFGFASLLFYFKYRAVDQHWKLKIVNWNLLLMAIFGGLSMSIKWTGIAFLGLAGIIELTDIVQGISFKRIINLILYFAVIPLVLYFLVFVIHFSLLTKSGEGDAFMTPAFQSTLAGSAYAHDHTLKPLNVFQKFIELNKEMYVANKTLTATHPYSSKWYTWPFMIRPIYYWDGHSLTSPDESKIYLVGNPLIWWGSTVAALYLLLISIGRGFWKNKIVLILLGGYLINYLPFIGIGRVMFLYHYFSALIFAILIFAYLIDPAHAHMGGAGQQKNRKRILIGLLVISALLFVYFAPLSYGLPLSARAFQNRLWLTTWQ
jgi:dolichyl-phosphate-mannose--protein O-mannosyl transferase